VNNEIVPGFDEVVPRLDPSWGSTPIRWNAIQTELVRAKGMDECLIIRLTGELEGFNASYFGRKDASHRREWLQGRHL
jgi:hypothetical protein